ncbi:MAG: hypothetical protein Q9203_002798, partial [Teloschistes exilis]
MESCQVVMVLFQNGERQSLWSGSFQGPQDDGDASSMSSEDSAADDDENSFQEVEARLRGIILAGQLPDYAADTKFKIFHRKYNEGGDRLARPTLKGYLDYSSSDIALVVPARSTQELRAVIQIKELPQSEAESSTRGRKGTDESDDLKNAAKGLRSGILGIRVKQRSVVAKTQSYLAMLGDHLELGKGCAWAELFGEARYHMFTACLMTEHKCGVESVKARNMQFRYAKFLNKYGWSSVALEAMERLFHDLSTREFKHRQFSTLKEKIRLRLAALYLDNGNFSGAEKMYMKAFNDEVGHAGKTDLTPSAAHCLERAAWAQMHQKNYIAARSNYLLLLDRVPSQRNVILINLGFTELRLGRNEQARWRYETALSSDTGVGQYYPEHLHAQSGLFASLPTNAADVEGNPELADSLVRYVDVFTPPFHSAQPNLPISEGPFHFAMTRQSETLLTACSIPVTNGSRCTGVAFVDADPLGCIYEGRYAYFQFRFLIQCHKLISQAHKDVDAQREATDRIKTACQNHLTWVYKIAKISDTWQTFYQSTQHIGNLWVERSCEELLKPYDTLSAGNGIAYRWCPEYELSPFMSLWLALKAIERLRKSIGQRPDLRQTHTENEARSKFDAVKQSFDDYGRFLNPHSIRSNILRTFIVSKQDKINSRYTTGESLASSPTDMVLGGSPINGRVNSVDSTRSVENLPLTREANPRVIASRRSIREDNWEIQPSDIATIEAAAKLMLSGKQRLTRTKDLHVADFKKPQQIALALFSSEEKCMLTESPPHEIQKLSQERLLLSLYDSGAFAQKLVDDAPEPMRTWSGLTYETSSILVGSLYPACRLSSLLRDGQQGTDLPQRSQVKRQPVSGPGLGRRKSIVMPQQAGNSTKSGRGNIIDSVFLPDWMYHHPEYIHNKPLQINVEAAWEQVESLPGLATAAATWRTQRRFSRLPLNKLPFFFPHVADAGAKESGAFDAHGKSVKRLIAIDDQLSARKFYDRLVRPRTFDQAKKRLIELASHDMEMVLICWLTAHERERPLLLDFVRRHGSSTCLFGERVDWKGNIWDTEIHLGFYQLIDKDENVRFPPHLEYPSRLRRVRTMPTLSNTCDHREITLVSTSLRFAGDLRDRSWTCHFFSSTARDEGFGCLSREVTELKQSKEDFYSETMGQRKPLEMTYVQKISREMEESSEGILAAFQSELDVPDTRDPQRESYEFVHNYSRLHLKSGEILRDVLTQLDLALRAIEEWEGRENTRPVRSRWSKKDDARHGQKLSALSRKCTTSIQSLRMQRNRLEEQQKSAEQRHSNLVSYMQLSEARTSSRSAEDVRLFTYVTIIFLPLSFSSSLFSMQAAPTGGTLHRMIPTTIIALIVTIFVLSNLKALDRNANFWLYQASANARAQMKSSKPSWGVAWHEISQELEESAQIRFTKPQDEKHLPAQSKWWYLLFGLSYVFKFPKLFVLRGHLSRNMLKKKADSPATAEEAEAEPHPQASAQEDESIGIGHEVLSEEDEREKAIEQKTFDTPDSLHQQQHTEAAMPESDLEKSPWCKRWKSNGSKQKSPPPTSTAQPSAIPSNPPPGNQLEDDDDVCSDYKTCSTKGLAYWKTLQAILANPNSRDRTDGLSLFNAHYKASFDYTSPADPDLHQDLLNHGLEADHLDRWTTYNKKPSTTSPTNHFFAPYENIFDTHGGAIIAEANYRDWDNAKKLPWSELMYITYAFAARRADEENRNPILTDDDEEPHPPGGPISNLKHVIQHIVVNERTKAVLRNAYGSNGLIAGADKVAGEG